MSFHQPDLEEVRDQLWAEAVHRFEKGELWWLTPQEQAMSSEINSSHAVQSIHETLVENYLQEIKDESIRIGKTVCFTVKEMLQEIYTDEDGNATTQRPANYENYYPSMLLRLGATQENNGKRCRRRNAQGSTINQSGWWSA